MRFIFLKSVSMDMYQIFLKATLFLIKILSDVKRDSNMLHLSNLK